MNPRYKATKKWTEFPSDLTNEISQLFKQTFDEQLKNYSKLTVQGRFYEKEIILRVGLNRKGELRFNNFEVSIDHKNEAEKVIEQVYILVDALGSLLIEFFDNEDDIELPYTWMEYPFNNHKIWIQFSSENPDLEAEANKLLGETDDHLLKNADDEESLDILDATEEQFDEFAEKLDPHILKKNKKEDMH